MRVGLGKRSYALMIVDVIVRDSENALGDNVCLCDSACVCMYEDADLHVSMFDAIPIVWGSAAHKAGDAGRPEQQSWRCD